MAQTEVTSTTSKTTTAAVVTPSTIVRKKKRSLQFVWYGLILLVLGAAGWFFFLRAAPAPATIYRMAVADVGSISKAVTATGTVQAVTTVQVGSQVSGTIQMLYADFNSKVTKGQLLAKLDPTFYVAALNSAQANLAKAKADLTNAQRNEKRSKELLAKQLVAQQDYDLAETQLLENQSTVKQVQAQVDQAQVNLSYTVIHSPISGVVVSRNVDKGQTVAASLNAPTIFVIAEDLAHVQVAASVDEADIGQVQPDQDVKFTVDAYPGVQFTGVVGQVRINPTTVQNVVTYTVMINAENPGLKLMPGMTATVTIVSDSREDVLRIPASALRFASTMSTTGGGRRGMGRDTTKGGKDTTKLATAPNSGWSGKRDGIGGGKADSSGGGRPVRWQTVFMKPKTPLPDTAAFPFVKVKIKTGLTDGSFTEVLESQPALVAGDSLVVGAYTPTIAGAPSSANPLNASQRGGQPGGGGGRQRF